MSGRGARLGLLLVALTACASGRPVRATRVEREQRVVADSEARTRWFATLYSLQRELATADLRRIEVLRPLQVMLCIPAEESLARVGEVAQARMSHTGIERAPTRLRRSLESEATLTRWIEASASAAGDASRDDVLVALEETLRVVRTTPSGTIPAPLTATSAAPAPEPRCEPGAIEGTQGADGPAVLAQLVRVLRRSAAQAMVFERAVALANELRSLFPGISAGAPPAVAAELRAADRALDGIRARATMFLHESTRTERWALALLSPEDDAAQEEAPRVAPEARVPGDDDH